MRMGGAAVMFALSVSLASTLASARTIWTRPAPGILHVRHRELSSWNAIIVDLKQPGLRVVTSSEEALQLPPGQSIAPRRRRRRAGPPPRYRWMRTSTFAESVHAEVAINANYFDIFHRQFTTCGLTMSRGSFWRSTYQDDRLGCTASVGFGSSPRAEVFDSTGSLFGPLAQHWMTDVVTGGPRILRDGDIEQYTHPRHAVLRNPRTGLGVSRDGTKLIIVVVDGREGHGSGMTCPQLAHVMQVLGAWNAINLDGGGSSTLYIRREGGIVSRTGERWERGVGNHLGIVIDPPATARAH